MTKRSLFIAGFVIGVAGVLAGILLERLRAELAWQSVSDELDESADRKWRFFAGSGEQKREIFPNVERTIIAGGRPRAVGDFVERMIRDDPAGPIERRLREAQKRLIEDGARHPRPNGLMLDGYYRQAAVDGLRREGRPR